MPFFCHALLQIRMEPFLSPLNDSSYSFCKNNWYMLISVWPISPLTFAPMDLVWWNAQFIYLSLIIWSPNSVPASLHHSLLEVAKNTAGHSFVLWYLRFRWTLRRRYPAELFQHWFCVYLQCITGLCSSFLQLTTFGYIVTDAILFHL